MKTNKEYFFCSVKERPPLCLLKNNTCCFNCDDLIVCRAEHKRRGKGPHPCPPDELESDEVCCFMV